MHISGTTLFALAEWALRIVALFAVPRGRSDASARAWLLLIFFFPTLGWLFFAVFGSARFPQWRLDRRRAFREGLEPRLDGLRERLRAAPLEGPSAAAARVAHLLGRQPPLGGNRIELFPGYGDSIRRLVADIDGARHHVHLLYYIFLDDEVGRSVAEALARAAQRGVECRVLVDALGSKGARKRFVPWMRGQGVRVNALLKVRDLRRSARVDLRNHRKVAVIDGRIGYTGSQNLVTPNYKPGVTYEELVVRVQGPAALGLQVVFIADWHTETEELLSGEGYLPPVGDEGSSVAQVLPGDPGFPTPALHRMLVLLLGQAERKVILTTPYFIPDESLLDAMQVAVLRGVEVHLLVSEKMDQWLVGFAQRSFYEQLLTSGVQVHLYRDKFLHAKHFSIDDRIAGIGSSNLDTRSFKINAEVTLLVYDRSVVRRLREIAEGHFARSERLTLEAWNARSGSERRLEGIARLVSPLL